MSLRVVWLAGFAAFLTVPASCSESPIRVKWDGLSIVVGKWVAVPLPDSTVVTGKVIAVHADTLEVKVARSTKPMTWPKGPARLPRASMHTLEMRTKSVHYRVIGTVIGAIAGLAGGVGAGLSIRGGVLGSGNGGAVAAAVIGIAAAGTAAGYALGNGADRRSTLIEIMPD